MSIDTGHRPETRGFQKPLRVQNGRRASKTKAVGLAVVSYVSATVAACSCEGWVGAYHREKLLEDAIDRHINKKHGGRGIRL